MQVKPIRHRVGKGADDARPTATWGRVFAQALEAGFLPSGRLLSAAGTELQATPINCFVQPVGDSISRIDDDHSGIDTALTEAAATMQRGGGVGDDFVTLVPKEVRFGNATLIHEDGRSFCTACGHLGSCG